MLIYKSKFLITNHFLFYSGHGDSNSKNVPTLVKEISMVGQVACGSSHTIAVSLDGRTVWSFGAGDNGENVVFIFTYSLDKQEALILWGTFMVNSDSLCLSTTYCGCSHDR